MKNKRELLDLLGSLCNGDLTVSQKERLETILDNNPESQIVYRDYMAMHAELAWQQGVHSESPSVATKQLKKSSRRFLRISWPLALAACLLIGLAIGLFGGSTEIGRELVGLAPLDGARVNNATRTLSMSPVAKISGSRNCLWDAGSQPIAGQIGY